MLYIKSYSLLFSEVLCHCRSHGTAGHGSYREAEVGTGTLMVSGEGSVPGQGGGVEWFTLTLLTLG